MKPPPRHVRRRSALLPLQPKGDQVIVVGVDPHKRTHTAVAIERASGELRAELTVSARAAGHEELLLWARQQSQVRLFALEDCRHVSGALERFLRSQSPGCRRPAWPGRSSR